MAKARKEKQKQARQLRKQGLSYKQIADELNISKGSAHHWCKDIILSDEQKQKNKERMIHRGDSNRGAKTNRRKALADRQLWQAQGKAQARNKRELHMIGCMLYWAEGAKYFRNMVHFANSDSEMIITFANFLKSELDVPIDAIKLQIHCYAKSETEQQIIEQYWLDLLGLPRENLHQIQVLVGSNRSKNRLEYGVCAIRVHSTEVLQHIFGAIQEYGDFENEDWLF